MSDEIHQDTERVNAILEACGSAIERETGAKMAHVLVVRLDQGRLIASSTTASPEGLREIASMALNMAKYIESARYASPDAGEA